jgi:uncharacterized protein
MTNTSFRLMQFHQKLDTQLRAELAKCWPDFLQIVALKKQKLAVKDRLRRLAMPSLKNA